MWAAWKPYVGRVWFAVWTAGLDHATIGIRRRLLVLIQYSTQNRLSILAQPQQLFIHTCSCSGWANPKLGKVYVLVLGQCCSQVRILGEWCSIFHSCIIRWRKSLYLSVVHIELNTKPAENGNANRTESWKCRWTSWGASTETCKHSQQFLFPACHLWPPCNATPVSDWCLKVHNKKKRNKGLLIFTVHASERASKVASQTSK